MFHDELGGGHDFGHSGLVICSEQGVAVGGDQGLAHIVLQLGEFLGVEFHALELVEDDGLAVVVLHYAWLDAAAGGVGGGVHMGDESYGGDVLFYIGGYGCHQVSIFIKFYFFKPHGLQFFSELIQKGKLLVGTGLALRVRVRCRVECHVPQKSVNYFFHI